MDAISKTAIDIVEAAYDVGAFLGDWLPNVIESGEAAIDFGMGVGGALWAGASPDGQPLVVQMHVPAAVPDLPLRYTKAALAAGPAMVAETSRALLGRVNVLSETKERWPGVFDAITTHVGCKDMLSLFAVDPDLFGATVTAPSPKPIALSRQAREHWHMVGVHIAAGRRLGRVRAGEEQKGLPPTEMPLDAEALLDPKRFVVAQAAGDARESAASETIRKAAMQVDKARGRLRRTDPGEALELWQGLVRGRWSLIDWFDTDGRRFVLAKPNAPHVGDPRGLTERQYQVATYAALGESSKLIGYRLGLSPQRVSTLLRTAMRKLRVKSQAQLVEKLRGLPLADDRDSRR